MKEILLAGYKWLLLGLLLMGGFPGLAQIDSAWSRIATDTSQNKVVQDAIYNRPFIQLGKTTTAVGGYLEGNTNYFVTDGISEGYSMELRRFNIFLYSTIARRIKFLSELEFEHGTKEIGLETAQLDFEINPAFNLRMGILVVPIGAFNQNHDSPKWEFIERPLVTTNLIPSTLSEVGFGIHGKVYAPQKVFTYDVYLVNGLQDGLILNAEGRTSLPAGKDPSMFGQDNNGRPMLSAKLAFRHRKLGEVGISYYGGAYNAYKIDGMPVTSKKNLALYALDFNTTLGRAVVNGEFAHARLQLPPALGPAFGNRQTGGYLEVVYTVLQKTLLDYPKTALNANLRIEMVDYNVGRLSETGTRRHDDIRAIVPGLSIRPSANTVIRANYRYHWTRDLLGNPPARTGGFQVGFASYF
ncbi:hypothetical protein [Adhaeribacter rhizoryzae]|uniref:Porin n=1 Tax=Adhaeribacter rhizoryzae TaxID=2607907 RepID=A0A5M6D3D7_9BACT|nr:hypothetical protein [Adhaeribacter rhizoryzae]KAA5542018.1 hypothetical protein F0145_19720 [Adhaeribacter rhizoryzae]